MKEWTYRIGEEYKLAKIRLPWWVWLNPFFLDLIDYGLIKTNIRKFIDLVNEEGQIRRIYIKDAEGVK